MEKKIKFIKQIQLWGIIFFTALGGSIVVIDLISSCQDLNTRANQMRMDYIARQKEIIKSEVNHVVDMINHNKAQSETLTKTKIKTRTNEAYSIAQHIYKQNKAAKTRDGIQQMILDALRPIRFEQGNGYYFITRLDGLMLLFSDKPEMEGINLLEMQDTHGKYVIKDMIKIAKQSSNGFYQYHWTKPDSEGNDFKKIAYIKLFEPFNFFIGTGLYVEDVEDKIKKELLNRIAQIRFGSDQNGYIFVVTYDGTTLMNDTQRDLIGKNIWELTDPNGVKVIQEERKAVENPQGDFIYYSWNKPSKKQCSPKVSFMKGIEEWEWMIGAGVYLDDVETDIALMHIALNNQIKKEVLYFILITAGITALFLFLFNWLTRRLENDFNLFTSFFNKAIISDEKINRKLIQCVELDRIAKPANKMLQERLHAQQDLVNEREQLVVTIKKLRQSEEALRRSEEKYKTLIDDVLDSSDVGTFILDADFKIVWINRAIEKYFCLQRQNVIGQDKRQLIQSTIKNIFEDSVTFQQKVFATYDNNTYIEFFECHVLPGKNRKKRWLRHWSQPIKSGLYKGGRIELYSDITESKQAEKEMLKMEKLKSIGTLAGGLAHDFNNILMGLFGNIAVTKKKLSPEHPGFKFLEEAEKSMDRATRLTKQLLTFAKGGAPVKENLSIDTLVEKVVRFDLSGSNVKPVFSHGKNLWKAKADKGQMQQVFSNLTINANQAMPHGGHLYITLENTEIPENYLPSLKHGKYIKITVQDEGTGIDPKHLERIFEPYFTTKQTGSGLGLATSYSILKRHSGLITVDTEPDKGTTFTLYLPAAETGQLSKKIPPAAITSTVEQCAAILVMDDDEMICEVTSEMLKDMGFSVKTAPDGKKAIELYKASMDAGMPFDVVIMDLTIPGGMGGVKAVKEIIALDPEARVVVSSGYADDPVMANHAEYGFRGILAKPYTMDNLQKILSKLLKMV